MSSSQHVPASALGTCTSQCVSFYRTRRCVRYGLTSALVCGSRIVSCLGRLDNHSRGSGLGDLFVRSVVGIGGGIPGSGDKGVVTMCCTCNRVLSTPNDSARSYVSMRGVYGSLHGLHSGSSMGTIMLHIGSPNNDTCNSSRV